MTIANDGTFSINVTTGGIDDRATIFEVALIASNVTPPTALGTVRVPADLQAVAIDVREQYSRTIQFAGLTWGVKESPAGTARVDPGNNSFSDSPSDVFVDAQGLHLGVTFHDGKWWSTEVVLLSQLGYGTYSFATTSPLGSLDKNITFGGFTWDAYGDDVRIPAWPNREIDFEAGRWGNAADPTNAQFVVQPHGVAGNLHRVTIDEHATDPALTNYFRWAPDHIEFATLAGVQDVNSFPPSSVVDQLPYTSDASVNHLIPTTSREKFRFNVWINGGGGPSDGQPVQIVIADFKFAPSVAPSIAGPLAASIAHGGVLAFDAARTVRVVDADAGISHETVRLSATTGSIDIDTTGVSVTGGSNGSQDLTIRGTLSQLNSALATLKYTAPNSTSSAILSLSANDGTLPSELFNTQISITNIQPTVDAIPNPAQILEDSPAVQISLTGISAGGAEQQGLTITATSSDPTIVPNPTVNYASPSSTATLSYTPTANRSGTVTITVMVRDDGGTLGGGVDNSLQSFTQVILPVNDPPSFTKGADIVVSNIAGAQATAGWAKSISPGPVDEGLQTVAFALLVDNPSLFHVQPTIDSTGKLSYQAAPSAVGTANISATLSDNGGTGNGGIDTAVPQVFTIRVRMPSPLYNRTDVNRDTFISPIDALLVINHLNSNASKTIAEDAISNPPFMDVNDDLFISAIDALMVINELNRSRSGGGEAIAIDDAPLNLMVDTLALDLAFNRRKSYLAEHVLGLNFENIF